MRLLQVHVGAEPVQVAPHNAGVTVGVEKDPGFPVPTSAADSEMV